MPLYLAKPFLIGLHVFFGEIGILFLIWSLVELLHRSEHTLKRLKTSFVFALFSFILSWIIGGIYYINFYGPLVKPVIKSGPMPFSHSFFMETKEHLFLFLPFMAFTLFVIASNTTYQNLENKNYKNLLISFTILAIIIAISIAFMGYMVSAGARAGLELK